MMSKSILMLDSRIQTKVKKTIETEFFKMIYDDYLVQEKKFLITLKPDYLQ